MDLDFAQEFPHGVITFAPFDLLSQHSKTEANGLIEDLNQHQPPRHIRHRGDVEVISKWNVRRTALEAFPISADTGESRLQFLGQRKRRRRRYLAHAFHPGP